MLDGDLTPRPLQVSNRKSTTSKAKPTLSGSPSILYNQCKIVPVRRSSRRSSTQSSKRSSTRSSSRAQLDSTRKDSVRLPSSTSDSRHNALSVRKQRRSDNSAVNETAGQMSFTPSLDLLLHMPALEATKRQCSTETKAPRVSRIPQGLAKTNLRSRSSDALRRTDSVCLNSSDLEMLSAPPPMILGRQRAVTGNASRDPSCTQQAIGRPLRRQPSFKHRLISRMISGLTGKSHHHHSETIDEDRFTCTAPSFINGRRVSSMDITRRSNSTSNTEPSCESHLGNLLATFPTPPKSYATSPTTTEDSTTEDSFETSRSQTQGHRRLSRPTKIIAPTAQLTVVPEFDHMSFETCNSIFVSIDVTAAVTTRILENEEGRQSAGLDIVVIVDNS